MKFVEIIFKNVFTVLYEQTGFCFLLAIMFMFFYMYASEHGWKRAIRKWWSNFRTDIKFRRMFLLALYGAMLMFRTLFNRRMWLNPIENIMGGWGLYNEKGELTTQAIENTILFLPLIFLFFLNFHYKILEKKITFGSIIIKSISVSFVISFSIECCQLFFRLGTMQIADLFYNTLGGLIGGLIYWLAYKITHRKNKKKNIKENQEN